MQLASSLVEYFVTGCGALLWLYPFFLTQHSNYRQLEAGTVVLLIPIFYAFGMTIDFASSKLLSKVIEHNHKADQGELLPDGLSETVFINHRSPDLGQALEIRSTRERIARGFLFNLAVAAIVIQFKTASSLWPYGRLRLSIAAVALITLALCAWWRFERLTYRFKRHAVRCILRQDSRSVASPIDNEL